MALPFLPSEEINGMFQKLKDQATTPPLILFAEYVRATWIDSNIWPPSSWSVYFEPVRTNNDIEGWHNGLNRRADGKAQLPLYLLINLLNQEAKLTALQIRLVSERKLKKVQRKAHRTMPGKTFQSLGGTQGRREICKTTFESLSKYGCAN